jgi:hypothetical protein
MLRVVVLLSASLGMASAAIIRQSLADDIRASTSSWYPVVDIHDNVFYGQSDIVLEGLMGTILDDTHDALADAQGTTGASSFPRDFDGRVTFKNCSHPIRNQVRSRS